MACTLHSEVWRWWSLTNTHYLASSHKWSKKKPISCFDGVLIRPAYRIPTNIDLFDHIRYPSIQRHNPKLIRSSGLYRNMWNKIIIISNICLSVNRSHPLAYISRYGDDIGFKFKSRNYHWKIKCSTAKSSVITTTWFLGSERVYWPDVPNIKIMHASRGLGFKFVDNNLAISMEYANCNTK